MAKIVRRAHQSRNIEANDFKYAYGYYGQRKIKAPESIVSLDDAKALLAGAHTKRERKAYQRLVDKLRQPTRSLMRL